MRFGLRAAVGVSVVAVLLLRADLSTVIAALGRADVTFLMLGTAAYFAGLLLSSLRWRAFLRAFGIDLTVSRLVRLYLSGTFFNAFLPTGVGGDAYKAIVLRRGTTAIEEPLASTLLDRSAGLVGLALLTVVGAAIQIGANGFTEPAWVASAVAAGLLGISCTALLLAARDKNGAIDPPGKGLRARIRAFIDAVRVGLRRPAGIRGGALWGTVTALLLVIAHIFLLAAVDVRLSAADIPGVVLLAGLTTVVPFSINGLGFREATYVWALGAYGVNHDTALAFALVVLGVTLLASAVGAVVYAVSDEPLSRRVEDVQDGGDDQQVDAYQERANTHEHRRG